MGDHTLGPDRTTAIIICAYGCYEVWSSAVQGLRLASFTNRKKAEKFLAAIAKAEADHG